MSKNKCPLLEECTIEFKKGFARTPFSFKSVLLFPVRLIKRIYNTVLLIRHAELREAASKNVCPMRLLNPFQYLHFSTKIISKSALMKAVLKHPRKDPKKGIFDDKDNENVFIPLFKDLFPEETISVDDFLFTCHQEPVQKYRQPILRFIGPQNIKKQALELQKVLEQTLLYHISKSQDGMINATEFSLVLTVVVISRLILGHPGPFESYKEITYSLDFVNKYIMKKALKQPLSKEEKERYHASLAIIRQAIDTALISQEKPPFGSLVDVLKEEGQLTPLQIKLTLYTMYFAGSDTTASLLNYLLWQLGQHPEIQEEIFREMESSTEDLFTFATNSSSINKLFSESLRLFTPTYVIGRMPANDLICTIKNKDGKVVHQEKIGKKEKILCMPTFAARDPLVFEKPNEFNPNRFEVLPKNYSWLPFGDGVHSCPGQWLAKTEILVMVALIVQNYKLQSFPEKEFRQLGYLTLKPSEEVRVKLTKRAEKKPN